MSRINTVKSQRIFGAIFLVAICVPALFSTAPSPAVAALTGVSTSIPVTVALPRIKTDMSSNRAVFINSATEQIFTPRGTNYIRLNASQWHQTFEPGVYSPQAVEGAMQYMQHSGYNYVRVFLDGASVSSGFGLSSPGISNAYLDNVADFVARASNHGIYVVLTGPLMPPQNYSAIINQSPAAPIEGYNAVIMHPGYLAANAQFWKDLLTGLKSRSPSLLSVIFTIDIQNEAFFDVTQKPLSMHAGTFELYGVEYDMSNVNQRQQLMDAAAVEWMKTISSAIRSVDSNILVSTSVFSPKAVGRSGYDGANWTAASTDFRMPVRPLVLLQYGTADYLDIHAYPHHANPVSSYSLAADVGSAEITAATTFTKPLIMGEFGAYKGSFPTTSDAAAAIQKHVNESCGLGFSGWGYWTWDTVEQKDGGQGFWTVTERGGAINGVIAPIVWSPICSTATLPFDYHLTASPNPCTIAPGAYTCTTTISWAVPANEHTQVWVSAGPSDGPNLFACKGGPQVASQDASWIQSTEVITTFYLYATSGCDPLDIVAKEPLTTLVVGGVSSSASTQPPSQEANPLGNATATTAAPVGAVASPMIQSSEPRKRSWLRATKVRRAH